MGVNYDEFEDEWLEETPVKKAKLSKNHKQTMRKMRDACESTDKFVKKVSKQNWKSLRKNKFDTLGE